MKTCFSKNKSLERLLGNISELWLFSHITVFLGLFLISLTLVLSTYSQPKSRPIVDLNKQPKPPLIFPLSIYPKFEVSDEDIAETIDTFKTNDPTKEIKRFQKRLEKAITNETLKKEVSDEIHKLAARNVIKNGKLTEKIKDVFSPVLKLYNREDTYEYIVLNHPTPYIGINTGSVVVVTAGLFIEAKSDDELLGYIAHEIGHEYFYYYSRYTKHLFNLTESRDQEKALNRHIIKMLGIIELQCDGFAAITLAYLEKNPRSFLEGIKRTSQNFEIDENAVHPNISLRIQFIESILENNSYLDKATIKSPSLFEIQTQLKPKFTSVPIN